ncbi:MAG: glutathione S-transferase family protein [Pseudomonadota bacterium]|nr:MAG: glutathione S-transferase family protein [Pseudomonadota bacterium]
MSITLFEFPHSHFCEKARWALDYKGIPYQAKALMPGLHIKTVRKYAPDTTVPLLLRHDEVVQGSSEIIDYLDINYPSPLLTPTDKQERQACLEIEQAMDERLGVPIRQIFYSGLLGYPEFVRHCFTYPMSIFGKLFFSLIYPSLRARIYQGYVISEEKVRQGRREFDNAMDALEKQLDQRQYLVGEQFSRADLTVASMLSALVMPTEHPFPWREIPDPDTKAFVAGYQGHPVCDWVRRMYRDHRHSPT